jgi:uncharacterized coiled-coil protein SlyX
MEMNSWIAIIIALIAALPGVLAFISQLRKDKVEKPERNAQTSKMIAEAAEALINPLKARVEELEEVTCKQEVEITELSVEMTELRRVNKALCFGVMKLLHQLRAHGLEPVFELDEELCNGIEK